MVFADAQAALGLTGQSKSYEGELSSLAQEHSYVANRTITFNCSIYVGPGVIDNTILDELKYSLVLPIYYEGNSLDGLYNQAYRDFYSNLEFDFGVSRQDRSASALWLSAYTGNYIGNCLSYLNNMLERRETQSGRRAPKPI